jgi:hypothetical protein
MNIYDQNIEKDITRNIKRWTTKYEKYDIINNKCNNIISNLVNIKNIIKLSNNKQNNDDMNFYNSIINDSIYFFKNSLITRNKKLINDLSILFCNIFLNNKIHFDDFTSVLFKKILLEHYSIIKRNNKDTCKYKWIKDEKYLNINSFEIKLDKLLDYHIFIIDSFYITLEKDSSFYSNIGNIDFDIDELLKQNNSINILHSNTDLDTDDEYNVNNDYCCFPTKKIKKSNYNFDEEDSIKNEITILQNKKINLYDLENKINNEIEVLNITNKNLLSSKLSIKSNIAENEFLKKKLDEDNKKLESNIKILQDNINDKKDTITFLNNKYNKLNDSYKICKNKCNIEKTNLRKYKGLIVKGKSRKNTKYKKCKIIDVNNNYTFKVKFEHNNEFDNINIYYIIFPKIIPLNNNTVIQNNINLQNNIKEQNNIDKQINTDEQNHFLPIVLYEEKDIDKNEDKNDLDFEVKDTNVHKNESNVINNIIFDDDNQDINDDDNQDINDDDNQDINDDDNQDINDDDNQDKD